MPFRDPEARRHYDRERRRLQRAGDRTSVPDITPRQRVRLVSDVEAILADAVELANNDPQARGVEKARALIQAASVGLRLVESANLAERLEALEDVLNMRRLGLSAAKEPALLGVSGAPPGIPRAGSPRHFLPTRRGRGLALGEHDIFWPPVASQRPPPGCRPHRSAAENECGWFAR